MSARCPKCAASATWRDCDIHADLECFMTLCDWTDCRHPDRDCEDAHELV